MFILTSMKSNQLNRFSSLKVTSKHSFKNRVVVPPMASQTGTEDGFATLDTLKHYSRLAQSEAGLIIVEYTFVHISGKSESNQLGIHSDDHIQGLSDIVKMIHQSGSKAGIQLTHSGGKSSRELTSQKLMGPSGITVPVKNETLEKPDIMTTSDIELWKNSFIDGARRAAIAGFDLIEFHSAHGYGLNQWISPITNQREDEYGQNLHGRTKILREIIQAVRINHPDHILSVRMPGQDFLDGGLTLKDTIELAKNLERLGVDILNISSGIGGWKRPRRRSGQGYLVEEAATIQSQVAIPVIGVGGIETGEYIDHGISSQQFSLAAVGRAILRDPKAWGTAQLIRE